MPKCINCGKDAIHLHHVVPKSLGGKEGTNLVPLCDECHSIIHGYSFTNGVISHSELTKKGLERARANGKQLGRQQGTHLITAKGIKIKQIIQQYSKDFNGTLSDTEILKFAQVSRSTYYKYKKELQEGKI